MSTNVETGSGKICLEAEAFWQNELETDSETINFIRRGKR